MKKDFDDIGKQTPYRTPEGFFEDVQRKIIERAGVKRQRKSPQALILSAALAMAAILAGLLFVPSLRQSDAAKPAPVSEALAVENTASDPMDKWIKELSDEELAELVNSSEYDTFLN